MLILFDSGGKTFNLMLCCEPVKPMLAMSAEPFDSPEYLFEIKWDGFRALACLDQGTRLWSRNLKELTAAFPRLQALHRLVRSLPAVLDGEIVATREGIPSFARLIEGKAGEVIYICFDLLYLGGKSVMHLPLVRRRQLLEENILPGPELLFSMGITGAGKDFYDSCAKRGLEGVVAKKLDSPYLCGQRSHFWLKMRRTDESDLLVLGYVPGAGGIRALLLGGYRQGQLVYAGRVGTGFSERERESIQSLLFSFTVPESALEAIPPGLGEVRWVNPPLVCRVKHHGFTASGYLRQSVWGGFRTDKNAEECIIEGKWVP